MAERGTPEDLEEFATLSARIADKKASDAERARWRELRVKLAPATPPAPRPGHSATEDLLPLSPAARGRQHPRITKKLRFAYTAEKAMPIGFSDEVSAGGLRLTLHHHVDVGALFVLRLQLGGPDAEPLGVTGRVAWVKRDGNHFAVGLEFVGLRPDERERIEAWAASAREAAP